MKFPGVVAVLCVVPSGLVLYSCTFPLGQKCPRKMAMNYEEKSGACKHVSQEYANFSIFPAALEQAVSATNSAAVRVSS